MAARGFAAAPPTITASAVGGGAARAAVLGPNLHPQQAQRGRRGVAPPSPWTGPALAVAPIAVTVGSFSRQATYIDIY